MNNLKTYSSERIKPFIGPVFDDVFVSKISRKTSLDFGPPVDIVCLRIRYLRRVHGRYMLGNKFNCVAALCSINGYCRKHLPGDSM